MGGRLKFLLAQQSTYLLITGLTAFAATVFTPEKTPMPEVRAPLRTLRIEVSQTSPAFAALADLRVEPSAQEPIRKPSTVLVAGRAAGKQIQLIQTVRNLRPLSVALVEADPSAISLEEAAAALVQAELDKRQPLKGDIKVSRHIATAHGGYISVGRLKKGPPPLARRDLFSKKPSRTITLAANPSPNQTSHRKTANQILGFAGADPEADLGRISIRGALNFIQGMAFVPGQDQISIYQEYGSARISSGEFYLNQGQYQIQVDQLKGRVIAEVRNREGTLMGRGEVSLKDLTTAALTNGILSNQAIKISPANAALVGETVIASSAFRYSSDVPSARVEIADLNREIIREIREKKFVDKEFRLGSRVLARATAPSHWATQKVIESGAPFQLGLFPESTMSALLNIATQNKFVARDGAEKAVLWGRVTLAGHPVADATIQLLTEKSATPTYFNGIIPDPKLKKTSDNGEFVFTGVEGGVQFVQATVNGEKMIPMVVFAEAKSVSQVDYMIQPKQKIEFGVFSADNASQFQPFRLKFVGLESYSDVLETKPRNLELAIPLQGMAMAEIDPGVDFSQTRVLVSGHEKEIHAPAFSRTWEQKFGSNLIVGEAGGDSYSVVVMNSMGTVQSAGVKVTYLDEQNNPTAADMGEDGQRFVVSGLTSGFYTIAIIPMNSKQVLTDIVFVDAEAITYINKQISDF